LPTGRTGISRGEDERSRLAAEHIMTGFGELSTHADVVPGIHDLAHLGVRLMTLSNGSASVAEGLLTRAGIRSEFEALPWDIDGAHRAGLRTAWVNRSGGPYPGHLSPADIDVTSLTDLAEQLAALPADAH
jgi:2-haloacid dehalogenase